MDQKDEAFRKRLLSTFKIEAEEHLQAISSGLLELEKAATAERRMEILETVFREAHSLKGAARAVNLADIEAICQALEGILAALKRQEIDLSPALLDRLSWATDRLGQLLLSAEAERTAAERAQITELIQGLKEVSKGNLPPPLPQPEEPKVTESQGPFIPERPPSTETVRISTVKLDRVLLRAEEMLSAKLAASQRAANLREVRAALGRWEKEWARVQPEVRRTRQSLRRKEGRNPKEKNHSPSASLLEFLDWNDRHMRSLGSQLAALVKSGEQDHRSLDRMVDDLLGEMKQALMFPCSSLLEILPKLAHDLSHDQGKEVALVVRGGEIAIDRRILEEMKAPLIHLVRNCIDHGIERPEERARKKKPPCGTVTVAISQKDGSKVEMLVSDDGAGIDLAKVRSAALKLGMVSPGEAEKLESQELLALVFRSGLSTSPMVTDLSGRGLGLAIVQEKVERLGGVVSLETDPDVGTTFRMVVPLTRATFRGILVRVEEHLFVLPTTQVERAVRVSSEAIQTVENRETISLSGQAVALVRLGDVLEISRKSAAGDAAASVQAVVLGPAGRRIAFLVDEVLGEQELLMKGLGRQLSRVRNLAGATVLGTGEVVPILNVPDLMKSAVRSSAVAAKPATAPLEEKEAKRRSVLVVEDSITSRTLIKNILEMAGYAVATAVDGADGLTQLRSGRFDIVVSDVDMPIMNGFDLTSKIRSDRDLSDLPVILVTALKSREDMERGMEVGANAYIVKSSFDQNNLLEAVRRLI